MTESFTNPNGVNDTTPEFSAVYNDPEVTDIANKYQIQVDDDSGFGSPIWDSGASGTSMTDCNQGDRCADISYAGSALAGTTTYYWRIKYLDQIGNEGAWSTSISTFSVNYAPTAPTSLLTEGLTNPINVTDTTPEFSAIYNEDSSDAFDIANKYRIQIDDDSGFASPIWDSGISGTSMSNCNQGARCSDISYNGSYLAGATTYYWRIRYWDDGNVEGAWSTGTNTFSVIYTPLPPTSLLTEGLTNPINVTDTTPEFSAIFNDDTGDIANKYRIQVDDDSGFGSPIWDSGISGTALSNCTAGNRCSNISYGGNNTDLQWDAKYYWRIKYWDDGGTEGAWSTESAYFTMLPIYEPTSCMIDDTEEPNQLVVKWNDNTSLETGYRIERKVDNGAWTYFGITVTNIESKIDNTISANHTYIYRVRANSDNGNSQWCATSQVDSSTGNLKMQGILVR